MFRIICFFNFVSIVIISKVTGIVMAQSQSIVVLLNLEISCDLSIRESENIFVSNRAIRKIPKAA